MRLLLIKSKFISFSILFFIIVASASCSKAVKPSEDIVRIKAILNSVTKLQDKYKGKDFGDFMAIVSPKYNASLKMRLKRQ